MEAALFLPFLLSLILLFFFFFFFQTSHPNSIVMDGLAEWKIPTLHVGDSIVFKQKKLCHLYMFHTQRAFDLCIFDQATLLHSNRGNASTYFTWHPSRPGNYYFSFRRGSPGVCEKGEKVQVRVLIAPELSPAAFPPLPAPPPTSGGDGGDYYPSLPHIREFTPPSSAPEASLPLPGNDRPPAPAVPSVFPFINSNPAVPIPTGETDSTSIRPLPITGGGGRQVVGMGFGIQMAALVFLMVSSPLL